jgi:ComEC/Rec2-related protein
LRDDTSGQREGVSNAFWLSLRQAARALDGWSSLVRSVTPVRSSMTAASLHAEGYLNPIHTAMDSLRRPLVGLTISFVLGLLLGEARAVPPPVLLGGAGFFLALGLLATRPALAAGLLHLAVLLGGMASLTITRHTVAPADLTTVLQRERERVNVVVVVSDDPSELRDEPGERVWQFPVRVEGVMRGGNWQTARGRGDVRWTPGPDAPEVRYGQRWLLEGPATRRPAQPGGAPEFRLRVDAASAQLLDSGHGFWLRERCLAGRRACAALLARGIERDPDAVGVMRAFMLGYREALPDRAHRAFSRTGTLHIAAISGAHVVILASLLLIPLKALGFAQTRWIFVMGPLLVLYALGTGLAASAVRACIMACVFWSAHAFRRRPDGPSALAFSALLIVGAVPGQLWEAGFLLSFGVVAGLMLLVNPLSKPLLEWLYPELPATTPRWRKLLARCGRPVVALLAVTLAAWMASLPMTAQYFNLFSPVGLVANLLVVPLASLILLNGCLILTLGWLSSWGAEVFNHSGRALIHLLLYLVDGFHRWPGGHIFVTAPPPWWCLLWYGALVGLAFLRHRLRWAAVVALPALLLLTGWWPMGVARTELAMTPMGRSLSVVVDGPGWQDVLVDPGPAHRGRTLLRWLHSRGVNELEAVLLTHNSVEVAGALPGLLDEMKVREVWLPAQRQRSPALQRLLEQLRQRGVPVIERSAGDSGQLAGRWNWQTLHPPASTAYPSAAAGALLLRLSHGGASALIAGSLHPRWQREVLDRREDVAAMGLIATSLEGEPEWMPEWLAAVRPVEQVRPMPLEAGRAQVVQADGSASLLESDFTLRWRMDPALGLKSRGMTRWR